MHQPSGSHRPTLSVDQARCFIAVARDLHFGRAAERLQLTQPAVSRHVQSLERGLGVPLFVRSSRQVSLTPAGRAFLPQAERYLQVAGDAVTAARSAAAGRLGTVRIGFTVLTALSVLGGWVIRLKQQLPGIDFILMEMVTLEQLAALESGRLDLAVVRGKTYRRGIVSETVQREHLVLATPKGQPLSEQISDPSLEEIAEFEMIEISPTNAPSLNDTVGSLFRVRGIVPTFTITASQVHTAIALVDAGLGSAIVPASAGRLELPGVMFRSIADDDLPESELRLAWREDYENPATRAARDVILGLGTH